MQKVMLRPWGILLVLIVTCTPLRAALTLLSGPQQGSHVGNLVVNGSFENGSPGPGAGNFRLWATGTTVGSPPFAVPPGWTSLGQPATYGVWGSDNPVAPFRVRQSDILPDGQVGMYFGNGAPVTSDQPPTFNTVTGEVTFPISPNFTIPFGGPARLWQNVDTHLNPSPSYIVSFWASGEGAIGAGNPLQDGIFGFQMTNVLAGDPIQWLTVPSGSTSPLGASHRYEYSFVPLNPLLPVSVEFINLGHFDLTAYGRSGTTELVIDDVMVNLVPEPGSLLPAALAMISAWLRRGRR